MWATAGWFALAGVGVGWGVAGCAVSRGPLRVTSDDPAIKLPAMRQAADAKARRDIPAIIDALDNPDPAVRLFAIESLEEFTGQTYGYRFYDSEGDRLPAIRRWRAAYGLPVERAAVEPAAVAATRPESAAGSVTASAAPSGSASAPDAGGVAPATAPSSAGGTPLTVIADPARPAVTVSEITPSGGQASAPTSQPSSRPGSD